jgi:hypothetical protein
MNVIEWSVWMEGYRATGDQSPARYLGEWPGETFSDACAAWADSTRSSGSFDRERLTYWGCRLFDNEQDARKAFG